MVSLPRARTRSAAVAGATVAALALAGAVAPLAWAGPLDELHDFDGDTQGFFTYANSGSVESDLVDGAFCADVEGGDAPWDIAIQHSDVALTRSVSYSLSFDVWSSVPVSVPLQVGAAYPAVSGSTVAATDQPQRVTLDFTPDTWPTQSDDDESPLADDWESIDDGQVALQLGAQAEAFTLCIDDVQLEGLTEWVPGGDFERDDLEPWFVTDNLSSAWTIEDGALCIEVPAGGNPWSAIVGVNGIPVSTGETYTFSFDAQATPRSAIRALVQKDEDPWPTLFDQTVTPDEGGEWQSFSWSTENETYDWPAAPENEAGQIAFQIGGGAEAWSLCLDNVSLASGGAPPEAYVPETGPRVRVNQHGYLPDAPKRATLVTDATEALAWELVNDSGDVVSSGQTEPAGHDPSSALDVHLIDFGSVTAPGTYRLVADGDESYAFEVSADLYQQLRYDALNYFYLARSGIEIEESIAGTDHNGISFAREAGHLNDPEQSRNDSENLGDYQVTCLTPEDEPASGSYYDGWTCPDGYALDVIGGWYDAGDHGKYVVNGGISVGQVMSTFERSLYAPTGSPDALGDGSLNVPEHGNGVSDVLDEARWELEFLLRMQVPEGTTMDLGDGPVDASGLVHHKIHDVGWTGIPLMPADAGQDRRLHRPSTAATLNLAAVAAQGARLFADIDADFAAELRTAALRAWEAANAHPEVYAPGAAGNHGGGPYDDDRVTDEFYWAAAELYLTTGAPEFEEAVLANPDHTADVFGPGSFGWLDVAGYARIQLALVPNDLPDLDAVRASVVAGGEKYLAWQANEGFGTPYPGEEESQTIYEWGSNSIVVNNANVLAAAFDLSGEDRFRDGVFETLDYLLGRNALNISYLTAYGTVFAENQHSRWFAHQANPAYPNPPAGALAGGPNSLVNTWDPTMASLFGGDNMCAAQACYIDFYNSWASNEITINWNSALSYLASFAADQGGGAAVPDPDTTTVTVTSQPVDVTVEEGETAAFSASAVGDPTPTVQWQRWVDETWVDVDDATSTSYELLATAQDDGARVRAVFTNTSGSVATEAATLTVVPVGTGVEQPGDEDGDDELGVRLGKDVVSPGERVRVTVSGAQPGETVRVDLRSDAVELGTAVADDAGQVALVVTIPTDTTVGQHTIHALGLESGLEGAATLEVVAGTGGPGGSLADTGLDVLWLALSALVLVLGGAGAVVAARRRQQA